MGDIQELYNRVRAALDKIDFNYRADDSKHTFTFGYKSLPFQIVTRAGGVCFYVSFPNDFRVAQEKRLHVAKVIAKLNFNYEIGNWEMDFRDGEIRYKAAFCVNPPYPDISENVTRYILIGSQTFERSSNQIRLAALSGGSALPAPLSPSGGDQQGSGSDDSGDSNLHKACRIIPESIELVQQLVIAGSSVNATNKAGVTPLMAAVCKGHQNICEYLVLKGANVNAENNNKDTPLSLAVFKKFPSIALFLLSKGASPDHVDSFGDTPLMDAARFGFVDVVQALLNR